MATIRDVARLAGVSQATVSRILNKDETISVTPEVRLRIFQAASQLNYVPPRQSTKTIRYRLITSGDWRKSFPIFWTENTMPALAISAGFMKIPRNTEGLAAKDFRA